MSAFLAGFAFELSYLAWLYLASRGYPVRTALMSMAVGAVSLYGLHAALQEDAAVFVIIGYGAGSYVAALWKKHHAPPPSAQ